MADTIDFYFDFLSPFSYLAHQKIPRLAADYGRDLVYHPVDLDVLKLKGENTGPSTRQMPLKYHYSGMDLQRWAARYGVRITRPKGHGPARLNRGAFFAQDSGRIGDYVEAAWRRVWRDGGDMGDEGLIGDVAGELGWDVAAFLAFTESSEADARLTDSTQAAHQRGAFGVPTFMIGDDMWWGNDRLDFVEEFLAAD